MSKVISEKELKDPTSEEIKKAVDEVAQLVWEIMHEKAKSIGLRSGNSKWLFVNRVINFLFSAANEIRLNVNEKMEQVEKELK